MLVILKNIFIRKKKLLWVGLYFVKKSKTQSLNPMTENKRSKNNRQHQLQSYSIVERTAALQVRNPQAKKTSLLLLTYCLHFNKISELSFYCFFQWIHWQF